jgi:hypothetical protein
MFGFSDLAALSALCGPNHVPMIATDEETVARTSETQQGLLHIRSPFSGGDRVLHPSAGYKPASMHPSAWKRNSRKFT